MPHSDLPYRFESNRLSIPNLELLKVVLQVQSYCEPLSVSLRVIIFFIAGLY
jgi:hypothetical protein